MKDDQRQLSTYELALALARAARMCDVLDAAERQAYVGDQRRAQAAMQIARYQINRCR